MASFRPERSENITLARQFRSVKRTVIPSRMKLYSGRFRTHAGWILPAGAIVGMTPLVIYALGMALGFTFHVNFLHISCLSIAGVAALWISLRSNVIYTSAVAFPILFIIGYPLRVISIEISLNDIYNNLINTVLSRFSFTHGAYWEFTAVSVLGLIGLIIGQMAAKSWVLRKKEKTSMKIRYRSKSVTIAIFCWSGLSVGIVLISAILKVGSNGIENADLPFKITGLLFFSRTLVLPIIGAYLFCVSFEQNLRRQVILVLLTFVFLGAISFPVTLSKASLLYAVLPCVLYLMLYACRSEFGRRLLHQSLCLMVMLFPVLVLGVQAAREVAYSSGRLGETLEVLTELRGMTASQSFIEVGKSLGDLLLDRIVGAGELMGVVNGSEYSREFILDALIGNGTDANRGLGKIYNELYGLEDTRVIGTYNGMALGLFGLLYLSREPLFLFIMTTILGGIVILTENLFLRELNAGAATTVGFMLCIGIWEGGFDTISHYPLIFTCIIFANKFFKASTSSVSGLVS